MRYENLLIDFEKGIATVTVNRPKALNALNRRTMQELNYLFAQDLPKREGLKGVVLTGAGDKSFVAGADIKEFLDLDAAQGEAMARYGHETFNLIERFARPVVAAVNGFALGGGCELAMACHLRLAAPQARFGQPEVNLGIIPGYGGTQRLIQYIGKGNAMELLLTADMIDAETAHRLGLVNRVVPQADLLAEAHALVEKIAAKGPLAVAKIIELVQAYYRHDVDGFAEEIKAFGYTTGTQDFQEGARAFVEKRKPIFKGK